MSFSKWLVLIFGLVLVSFVGFKIYSVRAATNKTTTYTVKRQTLSETLSFSGEIAAREKATLRFPSSGKINWIGVKVGDYLQKYQMVATQDSREVEKNLKKYLETYMGSRWDLEQTRDDYRGLAVTDAIQRILDKAQFDLNSTVLDVEIKNLAVEYSKLWTPIEGIVTKVDSPYAGVYATSTQAEFEVVNPKTIYFSATADQSDVVKLTSSQSGQIVLDAFPDQTLPATIYSVAFTPKSGETGTVYEVKMNLPVDNSTYQYRLGMTGDVNFTVRQKPNALALPEKVIKTDSSGNKFVWLKVNGQKMKKAIVVGETFDTDVEIKSGLSERDVVYEN